MKLAFIIDPISQLDPGHDTTVALMEAAQAKEHEVWVCELEQLSVVDSTPWAMLSQVETEPWYTLSQGVLKPLGEMNAVFMRKDPPVNISYLYGTYILDLLNPQKTLVVNSPAGLRLANEKMYALQFPSLIPATIVSQDKTIIRQFVQEKGAGVIKPLGGKGGEGILYLSPTDGNFNSLIEISTHQGREPVMVQEYLPAAKEGDKRIIMLDGKPIGAVNRIPTGEDFRGNMAVGGRVAATALTEKDSYICATVGAKLRADGLYFVGLDVIGGYLTEVNVTSPTGVREIDRLSHTNLGKQTIEWLEEKLLIYG
ncbi:MAG: glutathione synthase [Prochloron sp. SP5CPC1]|nr:glutathione synthase [Candidatus Paraprochloron terpiosi SP5CPC1]